MGLNVCVDQLWMLDGMTAMVDGVECMRGPAVDVGWNDCSGWMGLNVCVDQLWMLDGTTATAWMYAWTSCECWMEWLLWLDGVECMYGPAMGVMFLVVRMYHVHCTRPTAVCNWMSFQYHYHWRLFRGHHFSHHCQMNSTHIVPHTSQTQTTHKSNSPVFYSKSDFKNYTV